MIQTWKILDEHFVGPGEYEINGKTITVDEKGLFKSGSEIGWPDKFAVLQEIRWDDQ